MASSATANDPKAILDDNPMNWRQYVVVLLMVLLNALDGFDVLSSAFAAPGMSQEWGIPRSQLGVVLSAELVGMGFGSLLLGGIADRYGRKITMLGCLVVMAIGMYLASVSVYHQFFPNVGGLAWVTDIALYRFATGLGIGGMLAATNAVTAESTNLKNRSICMAVYVIGYPIGGVLGGFAAQGWLLVEFDWRAVFLFGAIVTAVMIPVVALLVPETAAYYNARRPQGALEKINRTLQTFGKTAMAALPARPDHVAAPKVSEILTNPRLRPATLLLAFGYMFHTITFYYLLKWAVQIVSDTGFSQPEAASVLTYANIGGAIGGFLFGFLMKKWSIKGPTILILALSAAGITAFGIGYDGMWEWRGAAILAMFFGNAAIVGFYAAFALCFPAHARATGTGFVLGVGRFGAASSPIIAGYLFEFLGAGELFTVSALMAMGSVVALILFFFVPMRDGDTQAAQDSKA